MSFLKTLKRGTRIVAIVTMLLAPSLVLIPNAGASSLVVSVCAEIDGSTLCGTPAYMASVEATALQAAGNAATAAATTAAMAVYGQGPVGFDTAAVNAADNSFAASVSLTPSDAPYAASVELAAETAAENLADAKFATSPFTLSILIQAATGCVGGVVTTMLVNGLEVIPTSGISLVATCVVSSAISLA